MLFDLKKKLDDCLYKACALEHRLVYSNAILTAKIVHPYATYDPIHQYVLSTALVNVILVVVASSCYLTH
jgi:hypothetical protein